MSEVDPPDIDAVPTLSGTRDAAFQLLYDVLGALYGVREAEEVEGVAGLAAWAAFDLLIALTAGGIVDDGEDAETQSDTPAQKST